ncbi:auxin-responsive protein SAUR68-like [Hevea brasiliensis]|uniref:auxin-responsive protein SAUR68-like n=1 Tax=Hevea brasiliensis TaxID=3981 RepID=UPI0025E4FD31|nr:auxin-responsive protein SAUR68-like [Hevea brasiliensis]
MISPKKLIKISRNWHRIASVRRKGTSFRRISSNTTADLPNTSSSTRTGNFVIYTNDCRRFAIPLAYLSNNVIRELFKMSEDVFGLPSEGATKFPCDAVFMEYVVSLIKRGLAKDVKKALIMFMETSCCSISLGFHQGHIDH